MNRPAATPVLTGWARAPPNQCYSRAMCGRACLDATVTVMIITFCGCVTANYFGGVGELFAGAFAEK
jgi:hypothetical protein